MPEPTEAQAPYVPVDQATFDEMKDAFEALPSGIQRVYAMGQFTESTERGGKGYAPRDAMYAYRQASDRLPEPPTERAAHRKLSVPAKTPTQRMLDAIPALKGLPAYNKL